MRNFVCDWIQTARQKKKTRRVHSNYVGRIRNYGDYRNNDCGVLQSTAFRSVTTAFLRDYPRRIFAEYPFLLGILLRFLRKSKQKTINNQIIFPLCETRKAGFFNLLRIPKYPLVDNAILYTKRLT